MDGEIKVSLIKKESTTKKDEALTIKTVQFVGVGIKVSLRAVAGGHWFEEFTKADLGTKATLNIKIMDLQTKIDEGYFDEVEDEDE